MLWRHSASYLLARGLPGLLSLAAIAIYTRLLGADEYGRYALIIAGVGLGNKLLFEWLRLALLRFLPAFKDRRNVLQATIAAGFIGVVGATAILGGLAVLLVGDAATRALLLAGIALLWVQALFDLELERVRSQLLPRRYGAMALGRAALSLAFGVAFVLLGYGPFGLVAGLCLGMLIALVRPLAEYGRTIRLGDGDWSLMMQLSRYGGPLTVTMALSFVIASSDRFLIGWLLGDAEVGRYAAGYDLATLTVGVLLTIVNLAGYPLVIRAFEDHGPEAARRELSSNLTALLAIGLPATTGFIILARPMADVLLGNQFHTDATTALIPLIAVASLFRDIKAYYLDLSFHLGRNTVGQMWITTVAAGLNILLNLWWIPVFGILGSAYATIVAYAVALVLSGLVGRRIFRLPWPNADALKVAFATSCMGLLVWQISGFAGLAPLIANVLCGVLVYGFLLVVLDVAGVRWRVLATIGRLRQSAASK